MTSDEYVVALEHKLERWEKVAQVEEKRMVDLNITKNKKEKKLELKIWEFEGWRKRRRTWSNVSCLTKHWSMGEIAQGNKG